MSVLKGILNVDDPLRCFIDSKSSCHGQPAEHGQHRQRSTQHTAQLASLLECTNETKAPADSSSPGKRKNWNPRALHNILCCIRQTMQRQTSFGFRRPAGQPGQLYCLLHVSPVAASMIYARQTEKTFCPSTLPPACRLQHRDAKRAWPFLLQREIS